MWVRSIKDPIISQNIVKVKDGDRDCAGNVVAAEAVEQVDRLFRCSTTSAALSVNKQETYT